MSPKSWIWVSATCCALLPALPAGASTTLGVTGGPGLDIGTVCQPSDFFCDNSSTDLPLAGTNNPVSGSFSYNAATNQLSFSLTLTHNVTFTGSSGTEILEAGSTFSATNVSVSAPNGPGGVVQGSGSNIATATLFASTTGASGPFQPVTDAGVVIDSLSCTTVGSGQCGVEFGVGGLTVLPVSGQPYDAQLTFNTSVSPVPLPASAWLLLSGVGALFGTRRRRSDTAA